MDVTGTVTNIEIKDRSKKAGIENLYTYLTIKVDKISPPDVASELTVEELSFTRQTDIDVDPYISVNDTVAVTVVGNDFSDPSWFRDIQVKKTLSTRAIRYLSTMLGKLDIAIVARLEQTLIDTKLFDTREDNEQNYLNLFPGFQSKLDMKNINLQYWTILAGLTLIIIALRLLSGLELKQYGNFIVTVISAGLISLIITPWLTITKKTTNRQQRV